MDAINNRSDILPDVVLELATKSDHDCSQARAVEATFELKDLGVDAIIGASCSSTTTPIAQLGKVFNFAQISGSATSPLLSNTADFPYFHRCNCFSSRLLLGRCLQSLPHPVSLLLGRVLQIL